MGSSDHCRVSARHQWGQQGWGRGDPQVSHQGLSTLEGKSEGSGLRVYKQAPVGGSGPPADTMRRSNLGWGGSSRLGGGWVWEAEWTAAGVQECPGRKSEVRQRVGPPGFLL